MAWSPRLLLYESVPRLHCLNSGSCVVAIICVLCSVYSMVDLCIMSDIKFIPLLLLSNVIIAVLALE